MERLTERLEYLVLKKGRSISCESGCDYTLPDYLGDVRRVLHTSVSCIPSGCYVSSGEISGAGVVCYNMIYLSTEGEIEGVEINSDFEFSEKIDEEHYRDGVLDARVTNYSVRVTGPRRFVLKASVEGCFKMLSSKEIVIPDILKDEDVEYKSELVEICSSQILKLDEREYAERIVTLEGCSQDEIKLLSSSATPRISSCERCGNEIRLRGDIEVSALIKRGELAPSVEKVSLPFDESVPYDDEVEVIKPNMYVSSKRIEIVPEEFGCAINADVITQTCLILENNIPITLPTDVYSTSHEIKTTESRLLGERLAIPISENLELKFTSSRDELGLGGAREIMICDAIVRPQNARGGDDPLRFSSQIRISGVAVEINEDGGIAYIPFKTDVDFNKDINYDLQNVSKMEADVDYNVKACTVKLDRNNVEFEVQLDAVGGVYQGVETPYIGSSERGEKKTRATNSSSFTVYYPDKGESLFEVAKLFDTTVVKIANANRLTAEVVAGAYSQDGLCEIKRLIIK